MLRGENLLCLNCMKRENMAEEMISKERIDYTIDLLITMAIKKNINELVDKGLVERVGSARKGYCDWKSIKVIGWSVEDYRWIWQSVKRQIMDD